MEPGDTRTQATADAAQAILAAVKQMHQRNRTVKTAYGAELGVTESAVLQESLAAASGITAKALALRLCLSPVKISRLLKGMLEQDLILRERHDSQLLIRPSPKGLTLFNSAYRRAQATFQSAYERLAPGQRDAFCDNLRRLNDALRAPPAGSLANDPPLMAEVRRLTRVLGFLGRDTFGSARAPLEWHSLSLILALGDRASCVTLSQMLGVTHATMSTTLNRLQQEGFLLREVASQDSRARKLLLTEAGTRELRRIEACGVALLQNALYQFNPRDLQLLVDGCRQYAGQDLSSREIILSPPFRLRPLEGKELETARAFVFETRVAQRLLQKLPESVLDSGNVVLGVFTDQDLCALYEFSVDARKRSLQLVQGLALERAEGNYHAALMESLERGFDFVQSSLGTAKFLSIESENLHLSPLLRPLFASALNHYLETLTSAAVK